MRSLLVWLAVCWIKVVDPVVDYFGGLLDEAERKMREKDNDI